MDNFLTWVDAPSEALIPTPIEDESNNYLRDEILQIQQFVIDKLDEQKVNDTEELDRSMDDSMVAQRVLDDMQVEARRSEAVRVAMVGYQKDCKMNELHVVSLKQNFPTGRVEPENYDKQINEMNHEVSRLQDQLESREIELNKRQQSVPKHQKDAEKEKVLKLRESYLENKAKHEKLSAIHLENSELQKEYDLAVQQHAKEKRELELAQAAVKLDEEKLEKLNEDNASIRAQLVQLESTRSMQNYDSEEKEVERMNAETEKIRQETAASRIKIDSLKEQAAELKKKLDGAGNAAIGKQLEAKTKALTKLLRKKLNEAKEKAKEQDVQRKMMELKVSIEEEKSTVEKKKEELAKLLPKKSKNVAEMRKQISTMESENRSQDKKIKAAVKQNDKLIEEIAKHRPEEDTFNFLDQTNDLIAPRKDDDVTQEIATPQRTSSWRSAPRLPIDVTPIHAPPPQNREISLDVFTGIPPIKEWMTSTPLNKTRKQQAEKKLDKPNKPEKPEKPEKQPTNKNVQTRAARRLAETQPITAKETASKKKRKN